MPCCAKCSNAHPESQMRSQERQCHPLMSERVRQPFDSTKLARKTRYSINLGSLLTRPSSSVTIESRHESDRAVQSVWAVFQRLLTCIVPQPSRKPTVAASVSKNRIDRHAPQDLSTLLLLTDCSESRFVPLWMKVHNYQGRNICTH